MNARVIMEYRFTIENHELDLSLAPFQLERSLVVQLLHLFLSKG